MNVLTAFKIQLRAWLPVFWTSVSAPFCVPFSRLYRLRLSACRQILRNPFPTMEVALGDFLDDCVDVRITNVAARAHNVSEAELLALSALVAQCGFRRVFEIGTFDGRTTRCLAANVANDGHVFTLNLPADACEPQLPHSSVDFQLSRLVASGERFHRTLEEKRITQLWGDSATFDYTPYAGTIEMVFIDGAHTQQYAQSDTEVATRLLSKAGGLIVWHDAPLFGVVKFLARWIRANDIPFKLIQGTTLGVVAWRNGRFLEPVSFCRSKARDGRGEPARL